MVQVIRMGNFELAWGEVEGVVETLEVGKQPLAMGVVLEQSLHPGTPFKIVLKN